MDLSDNTFMESNATILGVPELIELTVNDTSLLNQLDGHVMDIKICYNIYRCQNTMTTREIDAQMDIWVNYST